MSNQNVIKKQYTTYTTFHVKSEGVQIGNGNILNQHNHIQNELYDLREEMVEIKDRVSQLEKRAPPASNNDNYDKSSDEGEYQMDYAEEEKTISDEGEYQMGYVEEKDMINLTILYDKISIRVSRNQTVREVEAIIQEEYGRRYHTSDVDDYIYNIYSKKQNRLIYDSFNDNNRDLPLSFYGTENGDKVEWWSD